MEIRQVQYFLTLCQEGNFTRAAKLCRVSQPSITNAIKALEREYGAPLFIRKPAPVRPSELGLVLKPLFEQIDACTRQIRRELVQFATRYGEAPTTEPAATKRQPGRGQSNGFADAAMRKLA